MSRSGYDDCCEGWELIRWRGAVASAIRGKRGQAFLREMLAALDALPAPRLIEGELAFHGEVCALGAVGKARAMDMSGIDVEDHERVARAFDIPHALACEIMFENDAWWRDTPEMRFVRMRQWIELQLAARGRSTV
jgi:hypothetical protein